MHLSYILPKVETVGTTRNSTLPSSDHGRKTHTTNRERGFQAKSVDRDRRRISGRTRQQAGRRNGVLNTSNALRSKGGKSFQKARQQPKTSQSLDTKAEPELPISSTLHWPSKEIRSALIESLTHSLILPYSFHSKKKTKFFF